MNMKQEHSQWQPPKKSVTLQQIDDYVASWARHRSAGQAPDQIAELWRQFEMQRAVDRGRL